MPSESASPPTALYLGHLLAAGVYAEGLDLADERAVDAYLADLDFPPQPVVQLADAQDAARAHLQGGTLWQGIRSFAAAAVVGVLAFAPDAAHAAAGPACEACWNPWLLVGGGMFAGACLAVVTLYAVASAMVNGPSSRAEEHAEDLAVYGDPTHLGRP